jgi:hypothetical protein
LENSENSSFPVPPPSLEGGKQENSKGNQNSLLKDEKRKGGRIRGGNGRMNGRENKLFGVLLDR